MKNYSGLPAVPVFVHDPMISVWDCGLLPTSDDTRHWTNVWKEFNGTIIIDGQERRFFGRRGKRPMTLLAENVTPLSSEYVMEELGIRFTVKFTNPLLLDDFDIMSTPITYVQFKVEFIDGKEHKVKYQFYAGPQHVYAGENAPVFRSDVFDMGGLRMAYIGQMQQKVLSGSGDHLTMDWGHLFFATNEGTVHDNRGMNDFGLRYIAEITAQATTTLLIGYDDIAAINYFGRFLPSYYARNGKTITEALIEFHERQEEILDRCDEFDKDMLAVAKSIGGDDYAKVVVASYRQSIAGHKLVADVNGDVLFISKENDSNGCAATVDVSYPSVPLYLLFAPELVRGMLRPIFKFANMPVWNYDFAPHDAGRYPTLTGQVYASKRREKQHAIGWTTAPLYLYPAHEDAFKFETQMPVEESGNMILMLAGIVKADGDYTMVRENLDTLRTWCKYLVDFGEDPGDQLCTDDFAGHLAHNINLSAKAVCGVGAFAQMLEAMGMAEEAAGYRKEAERLAKSLLERATAPEGYTYLTYEKVGWSQKYNVVWDKLLGLKLFPEEFYRNEIASYLPRLNEYGLPLDSRSEYTKSDWSMWVASMTDDPETFRRFVAPMAKFLRETPNRVPFSDFYDTKTGYDERFIARTVQGGCFMPILMKAWKE